MTEIIDVSDNILAEKWICLKVYLLQIIFLYIHIWIVGILLNDFINSLYTWESNWVHCARPGSVRVNGMVESVSLKLMELSGPGR